MRICFTRTFLATKTKMKTATALLAALAVLVADVNAGIRTFCSILLDCGHEPRPCF